MVTSGWKAKLPEAKIIEQTSPALAAVIWMDYPFSVERQGTGLGEEGKSSAFRIEGHEIQGKNSL